jgi:hypothetical protein
MDYCDGWANASGGFIADSRFSNSSVVNGSHQAYLARNSSLSGWTNVVWNQVFACVKGAPPHSFPNPQYTTLGANPVSREKPFLYVDATNHFSGYVPDARIDSAGITGNSARRPAVPRVRWSRVP